MKRKNRPQIRFRVIPKRFWLIFSYLVILALLSACKLSNATPLPPPGGPPDPEKAQIVTFRSDPGYGRDDNANGIIDMPNSIDYVQRSLKVQMDFSLVAHTYPSKWPVPEGEDPGLHNLAGPWRWVFTPVDVPQTISQLPVPTSTVSGAIPDNNGSKLVAFTDSPEIAIQLFEGDWNVELARANPDNPAGDAIYWKTVPLTIEDYLIVQLGDSYSAGQGSPEKDSQIGIWGDDGTVANYPISNPDFTDCITPFPGNPPIIDIECMRINTFGTTENFEHELAHRSSRTWGSLAAIDVEGAHTQTSVTYINLASSGGRIRHIYADKNRTDRPIYPKGNFFSLTLTGNLETDPTMLPFLGRELRPQLVQLQELIGNRPVDAVFVTFGGNDVGFAPAIAAYILRDPDEDFKPIDDALLTGDWSNITGWFFETFVGEFFPASNRAGFDDIDGEYEALANHLSAKLGIDPANVYIAEYPDPLVVDGQFSVLDHANAEVCPQKILTGKAGGKEVGRQEQKHARKNIIIPLNEQIAESAATYGWNLVNTATIMYGRPICGDSRMVNLFKQSGNHQGDENGVMHPNEDGYKATADALLRVLHLPNSKPGDSFYPPLKLPGSYYPVRPEDMNLWHFTFAEKVSNTLPEDFDRPVWGTYGLNYQTDRVFMRIDPEWCQSGEVFVVDARTPQDVEGYPDNGGTSVIRYLSALPKYSLRLVSYQKGHGPNSPQILLDDPPTWQFLTSPNSLTAGSHSILYRFEEDEIKDRDVYVVLSVPINVDSVPVRNARVKTVSSYLNQWGLVQLRTRCEFGVPDFELELPPSLEPKEPIDLPDPIDVPDLGIEIPGK